MANFKNTICHVLTNFQLTCYVFLAFDVFFLFIYSWIWPLSLC